LLVIDYFPDDLPAEYIGSEGKDPAKHLQEHSPRRPANLVAAVGAGEIEQEVVFSTRSATWEIAEYAREHAIDLVVTGIHGRHALADILSSTASKAVHLMGCHLLAVHCN